MWIKLLKAQLDQGEIRSVKTGGGIRQVCCLSSTVLSLHSKYRTNEEALERFGDFKIGGQVICTVKYADDLGILAEEEMVLHMTNT
jgi:hypothetical protein